MTSLTIPNTFSNSPPNTNVIDATQVNANFSAISGWTAGNIDETNAPLLSAIYGRYHPIQAGSAKMNAPTSGTYMLGSNMQLVGGFTPTTPNSASSVFYFDPALHGVSPKTGKLNLETLIIIDATAPGTVTFTTGMYPITAIPGGAGVDPEVTLGTVVSGSTAAAVNPGGGGVTRVLSGDFNMPSAGLYGLGVVLSANTAVNSIQVVTGKLMMRAV